MSAHRQRYLDACHAMQTGVEFSKDKGDQTPKQLRVGVNAAMSDHAALAKILIDKGIITLDEYEEAVADQMEVEADSYRKRVSDEHPGVNIKLV